MEQQHILHVFRDLGHSLDIEGLTLDERGYCVLFFDDVGINVEFDEASEQLFLYANICELPPRGERLPLYEVLLDGNSMFQGTAGGTIGVDTENNLATLTLALPIHRLDGQRLEAALVHFASLVRDWQERCRKIQSFASQEESPWMGQEMIRG